MHTTRLGNTVFLLLLTACGGGGSSGSGTNTSTTPPAANTSTLPRIFAGLTSVAGDASTSAYLKACYFKEQKVGTKGQGGLAFLESMVIDVLPEATAPLYNAATSLIEKKTNRAYKGSDGKIGAPPKLWTGVISINADGSANGFGAPCTPTTMMDSPQYTCYWLTDNLNGRVSALNYYDSIGDGRPQTSSGSVPLGNAGWGDGVAYYFWYEMGLGASCSAPESTTLWRNLVRCADLSQTACNN